MNNKYGHAHKEHINAYKMAHMIGVAEYMRERAKDYGLNPDIMYTIGLLHDIGYVNARADHERYGADMLNSMGLNEQITFAIRYHGENPYDVQERFGKNSITREYVLLLEADMSVDARGYRVGFEKRLGVI